MNEMNDFLQSLRNGQTEKPRTPKTRKNFDNSYHYTSTPRFHSYNAYQNTRNQQHMKKPPASQQNGNQFSMEDTSAISILAEAIENLSNHCETMAKNQEYMITAQERTVDMLERQAIAIEKIVDHLNLAPEKEPIYQKDSAPEKTFEHHYVTSQKSKLDIAEPVETPVEMPVKNIEPKKTIIRKRKKIAAKKTKKTASTDPKLLNRKTVMNIIHTMRSEGATFDQVASRLVELGQPTFSGRGEWHAQTIHRLCNKK